MIFVEDFFINNSKDFLFSMKKLPTNLMLYGGDQMKQLFIIPIRSESRTFSSMFLICFMKEEDRLKDI